MTGRSEPTVVAANVGSAKIIGRQGDQLGRLDRESKFRRSWRMVGQGIDARCNDRPSPWSILGYAYQRISKAPTERASTRVPK
jgi:hypothetical protein